MPKPRTQLSALLQHDTNALKSHTLMRHFSVYLNFRQTNYLTFRLKGLKALKRTSTQVTVGKKRFAESWLQHIRGREKLRTPWALWRAVSRESALSGERNLWNIHSKVAGGQGLQLFPLREVSILKRGNIASQSGLSSSLPSCRVDSFLLPEASSSSIPLRFCPSSLFSCFCRLQQAASLLLQPQQFSKR